jgi:ribosomal protein L37AE/L43A
MERHRLDPAHDLTPRAYRCPACGATARMRIVWPFWHCAGCDVRLIPADLEPREQLAAQTSTGHSPGKAAETATKAPSSEAEG